MFTQSTRALCKLFYDCKVEHRLATPPPTNAGPTHPRTGFGTCLPIYGKKQGEECYRDHDCEAGFLCLEDGATGEKSCQAHAAGTQTLGE